MRAALLRIAEWENEQDVLDPATGRGAGFTHVWRDLADPLVHLNTLRGLAANGFLADTWSYDGNVEAAVIAPHPSAEHVGWVVSMAGRAEIARAAPGFDAAPLVAELSARWSSLKIESKLGEATGDPRIMELVSLAYPDGTKLGVFARLRSGKWRFGDGKPNTLAEAVSCLRRKFNLHRRASREKLAGVKKQ